MVHSSTAIKEKIGLSKSKLLKIFILIGIIFVFVEIFPIIRDRCNVPVDCQINMNRLQINPSIDSPIDSANETYLLPVKSTITRTNEKNKIVFDLTSQEEAAHEDWRKHKMQRNFCKPNSTHPILNQADFFKQLAKTLNMDSASLTKSLKTMKGFPSFEVLVGVNKLIASYSLTHPSRKGEWRPENCNPGEKLMVLVPYRDRSENLPYFLFYMHLYLRNLSKHYQIVLVEQLGKEKFRRANLFNAAIFELFFGPKREQTECLALHDIDKMPISDSLTYNCIDKPLQICRQLTNSEGIMVQRYYPAFFGGVTLLPRWSYYKLNGMSNAFKGWGGEDDDFRLRTTLTDVGSSTLPDKMGKFLSIEHRTDRNVDVDRFKKIKVGSVEKNLKNNGLYQVKYKLRQTLSNSLYYVLSFTFD